VDEFRIGVAETYDVIVTPKDNALTPFSRSPKIAAATRAAHSLPA
jgi:FtsP/CotA-like multicopper oxidase with cupredoxin domain